MASSYRFVIADDHPLFRGALREALSGLFAEATIVEAGSFDDAAALLERESDLDLVLLDLSMPGVRGFSGLMYLRAQFPSVPVVVPPDANPNLEPCPTCGHPISRSALLCPACGKRHASAAPARNTSAGTARRSAAATTTRSTSPSTSCGTSTSRRSGRASGLECGPASRPLRGAGRALMTFRDSVPCSPSRRSF